MAVAAVARRGPALGSLLGGAAETLAQRAAEAGVRDAVEEEVERR